MLLKAQWKDDDSDNWNKTMRRLERHNSISVTCGMFSGLEWSRGIEKMNSEGHSRDMLRHGVCFWCLFDLYLELVSR